MKKLQATYEICNLHHRIRAAPLISTSSLTKFLAQRILPFPLLLVGDYAFEKLLLTLCIVSTKLLHLRCNCADWAIGMSMVRAQQVSKFADQQTRIRSADALLKSISEKAVGTREQMTEAFKVCPITLHIQRNLYKKILH